MIMRLLPFATALLLLGCGSEPQSPPPAATSQYSAQQVELNNRGIGLMGRYEYDAAYRVFDDLVQRYPDDFVFRLNRTIAMKNRQLDDDEAQALASFLALSAERPDDPRAAYCAGLLQYRAGEVDAAVARLQAAHQSHPNDPHGAYFLGQALQQAEQQDAARVAYQNAIEADPYLRSAYYALAMLERRSGNIDAARVALERYQRLAANPRAQLAEFKYTRMGALCEVVAVATEPSPLASAPQGELFAAPVVLDFELQPLRPEQAPPTIAVVDIDGDAVLDLFISGVSVAGIGHNAVLLGQADGSFVVAVNHPLASISEVNASAWGDYDNDGHIDVYLARRGPNQLWRQSPAGVWQDMTEQTDTAFGDADSVDVTWLDADHDGDLDLLLINRDAPVELFNNNLDGTFRPLAEEFGLAGKDSDGRSVLLLDLDNDRDTDLLLLQDMPPQQAFRNDLSWQYRAAEDLSELLAQPVIAALAADRDVDGDAAIYALQPGGSVWRWAREGTGGAWQGGEFGQLSAGQPVQLAWMDANGNGDLELLHADAQGWTIYPAAESGLGPQLASFRHDGAPLLALNTFSLDDAAGPHLIALDGEGQLLHFAPGPGRWPFVRIALSGVESLADGMRSNRSAIGTRLALRRGSHWTALDTFPSHSSPGHGLQPQLVGLGGADKLDFVRLLWSDGVMQTELDLSPGNTHQISETQRQLSSCPVLFAWDGKEFVFVSDTLGVAGIGFLLEPGRYAEPRPWENFLMPEGLPVAREGVLELKLGEPMEEIGYIDSMALQVFDLPPGWSMTLDERMGTGEPFPTGEPIYYRHELLPIAARMNGADVLDTLLQADLIAAPPGEIDSRFLGRLREPNELIVEFEQPIDSGPGAPVLMADGWVEYPYSQTVFAAWQAGERYSPPSLYARDGDGNWQLIAEHFGYPAGMPRQMALPLPPLPEGTDALRLVSNLQIYWDRIAVVYAEQAPVVPRDLPLLNAEVAYAGFALRTTGPQRQPHYDYARRTPLWDTRYPAGYYTELGNVDELLAREDGALAIFGPGEELQMRFAADSEPLAPGWQRRFVVQLRGWAKDMDLYTGDSGTVGPLPGVERRDAEAQRLHERFNTRYKEGY